MVVTEAQQLSIGCAGSSILHAARRAQNAPVNSVSLNCFLGAAFIAASVFGSGTTKISEPLVQRVSIVERGLFSAQPTGLAAAISTLGIVQQVRNPRLIESTTLIPGRRLVRFGVRYRLHGAPQGAQVNLKLITRFPVDALGTGRATRSPSEFVVRALVGSIAYREFVFDDDSEVIPGEWSFEFWHGSTKLGEQIFCVYDTQSSQKPAEAFGCSAKLVSIRQSAIPASPAGVEARTASWPSLLSTPSSWRVNTAGFQS